eukprot:5263850-Amphidinium_carterae.1
MVASLHNPRLQVLQSLVGPLSLPSVEEEEGLLICLVTFVGADPQLWRRIYQCVMHGGPRCHNWVCPEMCSHHLGGAFTLLCSGASHPEASFHDHAVRVPMSLALRRPVPCARHACSLRNVPACHVCVNMLFIASSLLSMYTHVSAHNYFAFGGMSANIAVLTQACAPFATLSAAGPADIAATTAGMSLPVDADVNTTSLTPMDLETQTPGAGPAPTQLPTAHFPVTSVAAGPADPSNTAALTAAVPPLIGEQDIHLTTDEIVMATHMDVDSLSLAWRVTTTSAFRGRRIGNLPYASGLSTSG